MLGFPKLKEQQFAILVSLDRLSGLLNRANKLELLKPNNLKNRGRVFIPSQVISRNNGSGVILKTTKTHCISETKFIRTETK